MGQGWEFYMIGGFKMNDETKKNYTKTAVSLSCPLADEQETLMIETPQPKEMVYADGFSEDKFSYIIKKKIGAPFKTLENSEDLEDYLKKNWSDAKKFRGCEIKASEFKTYFLITIERREA